MAERNLAEKIGKRGPFDSLEQEAYLTLMRTNAGLTGQFAKLFKVHGLSETSYNLLRILRGEQDTGDSRGLPSQEIKARLVSRLPDVTRLVDRLARSGLVERATDKNDRRVTRVRITESGRLRLAALDEPVVQLHRRQLGAMTPGRLQELIELLGEVCDVAGLD